MLPARSRISTLVPYEGCEGFLNVRRLWYWQINISIFYAFNHNSGESPPETVSLSINDYVSGFY